MDHTRSGVEDLSARLHFTGDLPWQAAIDRAKERSREGSDHRGRHPSRWEARSTPADNETGGLSQRELSQLLVIGFPVNLFPPQESSKRRRNEGHLSSEGRAPSSKRPRLSDYEASSKPSSGLRIIDADDDFPQPEAYSASPRVADPDSEDDKQMEGEEESGADIDRYDIRHVISVFSDAPGDALATSEKALDEERWRDLDVTEEEEEADREGGVRIAPPQYAGNPVPKDVSDQINDSRITMDTGTLQLVCPFAVMSVPSHIRRPGSLKVYKIIEHTARKISGNKQLEVLLRVRHKDDADFQFLLESDDLHAFYQHLVRRASSNESDWPEPSMPLISPTMDSPPPANAQSTVPKGLVSYDEDDEDDETSTSVKLHETVPAAAVVQQSASLPPLKQPQGLPPADMLMTIEKMLAYVQKNGAAFLDLLRNKEAANPKFSFLMDWSPYNAYFQERLRALGRGENSSAKTA